MPARRITRALVLGLVAVLAAAATASAGGGPSPPFVGPTLTHPAVPPDFALRDQRGRLVRLSGLRGKVVLLTFLYTHCPDVCPLTATNLNTALTRLGAARKDVRVLAVSVDPTGDTHRSVDAFIRTHRLRPQFHYLTGTSRTLRPVWRAYRVRAVPQRESGIDHTLYTLLIDPTGKARVLFDVQARPSAIAHDVRLVLP
ncbi:MAG: SCO family protein [Verrucomicrobiota bacterium]